MRRLTIIVIALAALCSGYWFIGAATTERTTTSQLAELSDGGWDIQYDDLSTAGFPSRFDTTLENLQASNDDAGIIWSIPFIQSLSLSYRPNDVILALADTQSITLNGSQIDVISDGLRASAKVPPATKLTFSDLTVETGPLQITVENDPLLTLSKGIAAIRLAGPAPHQYDVYVNLDGLAFPPALRRIIDPNWALPDTFDQLTIDGGVILDDALSATARPTQVTLNGMTITLGAFQLRGKGELAISDTGIPTGQIALSAQNWRQMLDIASAAGLIDARVANTAKSMGGLLGGAGNDITIPITFQNGLMSAGPIPLGPAPQLF